MLATSPDTMKEALNASGLLPSPVVAVGQLRQGKAPSTMSMVTGAVLWTVLGPRKTKALPRHFVMAVCEDGQVRVFKATGGSPENSSEYTVRIDEDVEAELARSSIRVTDLGEKGPQAKGATMVLDGEAFPVSRPNLSGDPCTDELLALLSA